MLSLFTVLISFKQLRVAMAIVSVRFFAWYYFGINLAKHQEGEVNSWINHAIKSRRACILAPRGHGKSEIFSKIFLLWRIIRNRNIRILLVTKADDLAVKLLKVIREELENNQRLINDFGKFYDSNRTWRHDQVEIIRDKNLKDPTVEAVGMGGAITGGRFDLIILDDIIDSNSVISDTARAKSIDYVDGTLIPLLEPWGECVGIGTRKHFSDVYAKFVESPAWSCLVQAAIIKFPAKWEIVKLTTPEIDSDGKEHWYKAVIYGDDKGEVLWPERWSMEKLLMERWANPSAFDREYQNSIVSEETAMFKLAWFEQCKDLEASYVTGNLSSEIAARYRFIIMSGDLALVTNKQLAEKRDKDYCIIMAVGLKHDGTRDLLSLTRERGLSPALVEALCCRDYMRINPKYFVIEANSFAEIHAENLIENKKMPIVKHYTGTNKHDPYEGVAATSVVFENGLYRLPYKTEGDRLKTNALISEFYAMGVGDHDDIVMATWIIEFTIRRILKGQINIERLRARPDRPRRMAMSRK